MTRHQRCMIALHDLGTRTGATHKSVIAQLKREGFTKDEILAAVVEMGGGQDETQSNGEEMR